MSFGPENLTRLRRFAIDILNLFQNHYPSIAEMMRGFCFHTHLALDYLRMTQTSAPATPGAV